MTPDTVIASVWTALEHAVDAPADPLRTPVVSTVHAGAPQSRIMVLRGVNTTARSLFFHTDVRSAKWDQIGAAPRGALLFWDPEARHQIRMAGAFVRFGPQSHLARDLWHTLPPHTRNTYASPPPGGAPQDIVARGKDVFGVLAFEAEDLDFVALDRSGNTRIIANLSNGIARAVAP